MTEHQKDSQKTNNFAVIGVNILIVVFYTLIGALMKGGPMTDAALVGFHFFGCLGYAVSEKKWVWALTALLVLMLGFSTCVKFFMTA